MKVFPAAAAGLLLLALLVKQPWACLNFASWLYGYITLALLYKKLKEMQTSLANFQLQMATKKDVADRLWEENEAGRAEVDRLREELEAAKRDLVEAQQAHVLLMKLKDADAVATEVKVDEPAKQPTEAEQVSKVDGPAKQPTEAEQVSKVDGPAKQPTEAEQISQADEPTKQLTTAEQISQADGPTKQLTEAEQISQADGPTKQLTTAEQISQTDGPTKQLTTAEQISQQNHQLHLMAQGLYSPDTNQQYKATQWFRKFLSIGYPYIEKVIKLNVIPQFVKFLERTDMPLLQFEAAWALTNVASGESEHTKVVIDEGAVPIFVHLLASPSHDVREQAVWALGIVAGDSPQCRDMVLNAGALPRLLKQLKYGNRLSMLRIAAWTLSNCCRGKPSPDFQVTRSALPTLARLINGDDEEVLTDACWAISYLSDGDNDRIDNIIEAGVCRRLVELLVHSSPAVVVPALRTVGNIVTGNDMQTQVVINCGALNCLFTLLTAKHKRTIKAEACMTISHITAGTKEQIQAVIDAGIMPTLLALLQKRKFVTDIRLQKDAVWAISNAISGGTAEQVKYLVDVGAIRALHNMPTNSDVRLSEIVTEALERLENMKGNLEGPGGPGKHGGT